MKRFTALLGLVALGACQRSAPLHVAPHTLPPANLRVSAEPLDPRRIKGVENSLGSSVLVAVEPGVAGDRISALVEVPRSECTVVIARGSESIEDLDLLAYGEDGTPLGSDEAPDRQPSLLICPPHPERVLLVARIAQGQGIVAVGAERVQPALAPKAAQRYAVKSRDANDPTRLKAWPGLDALITRERARVGGKFHDLRRVALALSATAPTTLPASIEAGGCVHGLFIPSEDVSHLDVAALDEYGRVLGRAVGSGRQRSVIVCSPVASAIAFEIRPHAGQGLAVAALSRSVPGTENEIDAEVVRRDVYPSEDLALELKTTSARLKKLGHAPTAPVLKLDLAVGRRSTGALMLADGCTRIDIVGASPLRGLDARLWSDQGQLRAAGAAGGNVTLFACGSGKVRLDAAATLGPGQVGVLTQREADVPSELTRWPLAGSRLLSRMVARGALLRASQIGKVSELALSAEQLTTLQLSVPLERCLEVDLGIEGPAAGVELRAVDQDTEVELDTSVGEHAASARLCAYGRGAQGTLHVRLELRAVSSVARGLFATRLLAPAD